MSSSDWPIAEAPPRHDGATPDKVKVNGVEKAYDDKGVATRTSLTVGADAAGLPDWRITYDAPAFEYIAGDVIDTYPSTTYQYRNTGFVSVSNVCPIGSCPKVPEPATLFLLGPAVVALVLRRRLSKASLEGLNSRVLAA